MHYAPLPFTPSELLRGYFQAMNAISSVQAALPRAPFDVARDAAATWRGRCLGAFARSEAAVTETLLVLAAVEGRGALLKLPHLVGQRYDALAGAIGPTGAFAKEGKGAVGALTRFRRHDALRTFVAHGVFTVTLDYRSRWHLTARVLALRAGRESRDVFVTDEGEAADILRAVEEDGGNLGSALGQIRQRLHAG